jgi:nitrogen-specific signal transduction histidine kinase
MKVGDVADGAGASGAWRAGRGAWFVSASASLLTGALFLQTLEQGYLVLCGVATLAATAAALFNARQATWPLITAAATAAFTIAMWMLAAEVRRVDGQWEDVAAEMRGRGVAAMMQALSDGHASLVARARRALAAPRDWERARGYLEHERRGQAESGVLLSENGQPFAWSGDFRVDAVDASSAPVGVTFSEFYVVLHATARDEPSSREARAMLLLHAERPADQLARSLEAEVSRHVDVAGFTFFPGGAAVDSAVPFISGGDTLLLVRPQPPVQGQVRVRLLQSLIFRGCVLLAVAALLLLAVVWRRFRGLGPRLLSLAVVLGALATVPLNQLSNRTRLFDSSVYYSELAGPLSSNAGTLLLASALVLLGLLALLRSQTRLRSRGMALWLVGAIAVVGPFFLRGLARGISPPVWGSSTALWLALQGALFLAGCVVLLAGFSAGRALLGGWRGLPAVIAVAVAVLAAAVGPLVLDGPGRYPAWYPLLWILAIAVLALARPARWFMLSTAAVAGLGAATLAWSASIRQRTRLAEAELGAASSIDAQASVLLERFGRTLSSSPSPRSRAALIRQYVNSDISSARYPIELFVWDSLDRPVVHLAPTRITETRPQPMVEAVIAARERGLVVQQEVRFIPGAQMLIAAPHSDGWVTTVLVAPRTRIVRDEPFLSLYGLSQGAITHPPYAVNLMPLASRAETLVTRPRWERAGDALHGDLDLPDYGNGVRAHIEVELGGFEQLVQRGTLVVMLDLLLFVAIWATLVAADGVLGRWVRARLHALTNSYRVRLTGALFGFFIVPAAVFAFWSQRSAVAGDRQARALLVTEALRSAESDVQGGRLSEAGGRLDAPLFLYDRGRLVDASDSLFLQLSPLGRRLPPRVFESLDLGLGESVTQQQQVGSTRALVGYRLIGSEGVRRRVLASPARADYAAIDLRTRDIGILLMFTTAAAAIAALALSGFAARQLARPIGILQGAALAIARGEREPAIPEAPRSEFDAVFSAFRAMASDLNASRSQLVEARRRTEAILRNVASGVVAFDRDGRVTLANPRSSTLLGVRLEPGTNLRDAGFPDLEKHVTAFLDGSDDEREFDQEVAGRQMHGWVTRLGAGEGGAVLTLDDVSEMARAQRVIAWGQMARQVAHEIKNPLTPIRLGVQHLRRAHIDRRADFDHILDSNVARILSEIDRLDEIARTFSRYGVAPSQTSDAVPVDAGDIVRDVVELEKMGEGEVEWRYSEGEGNHTALASEDELREVVLNLLENARHAGARLVSVSVFRRSTTVIIEVQDNGHGIAADVLPRVFEPNFSTRTSGSGLGLAISRKLIEGWGGEISIASEPGKGARATIILLAPLEL